MRTYSRKYEEEQRAAKAAEEKAAYERLLAAPRHHAESVAKQVPFHVPVYYLDHSGIQQQVGVEPRVPKRPCSDANFTRKRVIVQRIVHGPSAKPALFTSSTRDATHRHNTERVERRHIS